MDKNLLLMNKNVLYVALYQFLNCLERNLINQDFCIPPLPLLSKIVENSVLLSALTSLILFDRPLQTRK